jgi:LPXTG-motif cell wall-anchored protein
MQQRQLPFTGSEVPLIVIAGAAAIAAGALLRRRIDGRCAEAEWSLISPSPGTPHAFPTGVPASPDPDAPAA